MVHSSRWGVGGGGGWCTVAGGEWGDEVSGASSRWGVGGGGGWCTVAGGEWGEEVGGAQ